MKSIGMYMAIAGIASIVLHFLGRNLVILMWIDMWGETMGWVIRIGFIVVGAILFFTMPSHEEEEVIAENTGSDSGTSVE